MTRVQVLLTEEQDRRLERLARKRRVSKTSLVRKGNEALEQEAYQMLHRYAEHPFTFVDGTSFALMRRQRLRFAFAFDVHFATAGFVRIPLDFPLTS